MCAEVVSIRSEFPLGQVVDTNGAFIARYLASVGSDLFHTMTVGDNLGRVAATLAGALEGPIHDEWGPPDRREAGTPDLRIAPKADDEAGARAPIAPVDTEIRSHLGDLVFGVDAQTLDQVLAVGLAERAWTVTLLEAGTGSPWREPPAVCRPPSIPIGSAAITGRCGFGRRCRRSTACGGR